ncbi:hypothetical protein MKL01_32035, partial [Methylobacterium sp. J-070]|nr:hypothetical protein [Methylobacterium sp. J-070]
RRAQPLGAAAGSAGFVSPPNQPRIAPRMSLGITTHEGRKPDALPFQRLVSVWRIEATFNRLKDFRRIATRYNELAGNYASY